MKSKDAIIYYKGPVEDATLVRVSDYLRKRFPESPAITHRLFAIFVELAQNVSRYSMERNVLSEEEEEPGVGTLGLYKVGGYYWLHAQNITTKATAKKLMDKCEEINRLDVEGLKDLRRDIRSRPRTAEQRGGNIGLIQVAIRSGNPLEVQIESLEDNSDYALLSIISKVSAG